MSAVLSKGQEDRQRLRALLTAFLKTIDNIEEQERVDNELGKKHNPKLDAFLTLLSLGILQTELQAYGRIYIGEHQALFDNAPNAKVQ